MRILLLMMIGLTAVACAKLPQKKGALPVIHKSEDLFPHPRIHFASNQSEVGSMESEEVLKIEDNIIWLMENQSSVVILEGHCDEWGEAWYNLELGDRRARAIKAYLIEKGIDPERIVLVVSFGEGRPFDLRPVGEAWRLNRRVEFVPR